MKVSLYMAVSIDGYVATVDHNTDWVSDNDWEVFGNISIELKRHMSWFG